ncbi:peptidase M76 [Mycotypha africana]|uniref:peptidase M76 n=1 Tax=Mycotypha africana TaxID=64632 RepID=UPI0022FFC5A3|nr:peptidase M76 [Mycotypha africana]KAI8991611.1 peptidase M76 [Mycotypha africana]
MRLYEPPPSAPFTEQRCTNELESILNNSTRVKMLLKGIQTLNRNALKRGITCRPCMGTMQEAHMGYYDSAYKRIVICCDHIRSKKELEQTLIHELTHAFDSLRKGQFDSICHLIACGEIRASALGQCAFISPEKKRAECILKDAINSTQIHCGLERTLKIVKEVYSNCVNDEAPFR